MAVTTIPLKKTPLPDEAQRPGVKPVLTYGPRCPLCQRNYWLSWEPDEEVIQERHEARSLQIQWAMVGVFALCAVLFFVGAVLLTYGGRL